MKTGKSGQHTEAEPESLILQLGLPKYALSSHSGSVLDEGDPFETKLIYRH